MFNMFLKHTLAFKLPGDERLFGQQALHQCMEFFKTRQNYFYEVVATLNVPFPLFCYSLLLLLLLLL